MSRSSRYELLQYVDESGAPVDITSSDVNAYLREIQARILPPKTARAGNRVGSKGVAGVREIHLSSRSQKNLLHAVEAVARMLGNTPAICRRCYVHPVVLESYLDGTLVDQLKRRAEQKLATGVKRLPMRQRC